MHALKIVAAGNVDRDKPHQYHSVTRYLHFITMDAHAHTIESELEAWREVHRHVTHAVLVAKEAVAVAKAQRRYWMEEICANLTPEGKLTATSVWKKPTETPSPRKKTTAKRKQPQPQQLPERPRKTEDTDDEEPPAEKLKTKRKKKMDDEPKKKRIRLSLKNQKDKKTEREIVEVHAEEDANDSEGHIAASKSSSMMHAEKHSHYAHGGGVSPALHHSVRIFSFSI